MNNAEDPVFTRPESYGIDNLEEPGEPDRSKHSPVSPVPGTGRDAREEHKREHNAQGERTSHEDYLRHREHEERKAASRDI